MANQFSTMSMNEFYGMWGSKIDAMSRKIGAKVNYDFSLSGSELADDAIARAWIAMPKILKEYDSSISPLLPYIGQRLNWLFMSEKRKNTKHAQHEFLPADDSDGLAESLESEFDHEAYAKSERAENIRNALVVLKNSMPAGKHRDCLDAYIEQLWDESLELTDVLDCSRQYVHALKKGIPGKVSPKLAGEIRDLLRRDDTFSVYGVKNVSKSMIS